MSRGKVGGEARSRPRSRAWAAHRCGCRRAAWRSARADCGRSRRRVAPRWPLKGSAKLGAGPVLESGMWREAEGSLPARSTKKRLTIRSSSEWKVTTTSRPPGTSRRSAACRAATSSSSSPFTWMRSAWKVRVAGWMRSCGRWRPTAFSTARTSAAVVVIGASLRLATMARAMARERGSSPKV